MKPEQRSLLIHIVISFIIILLTYRNFSWRVDHIIGLDNISPYWGIDVLLHRALNSGNFFLFGPSLYNLPVMLGSLMNLSSGLLSQLNVIVPFLLGTIGFITLVNRKITTAKAPSHDRLLHNSLLLFLVLGNLVTIWIFNQPIAIFLSIYAALPWVLLLMTHESSEKSALPMMFLLYTGYALGISFYFLSSLNLVAFILLNIQLLFLALIINYLFGKKAGVNSEGKSLKNRIKRLWENTSAKRVILTLGSILLAWAIVTQALILLSDTPKFLPLTMIDLAQDLQGSPAIAQVTSDLREAELSRNTLVNSFRYATGWMELHDIEGNTVFEQYEVYNSLTFILLGLAPVLFLLVNSYKTVRTDKRVAALVVFYILMVITISRFGLAVTSHFYYLENALRWASSKLWPAIFVSYLMLFALSIRRFTVPNTRIVAIIFLPILMLYSYIWVYEGVLSSYVNVEMPEEYFEVFSQFDEDDTVYYYPAPQQLYFRQYDWGYYGSDFLSFMTKAEVLDIATVSDFNDEYFEIADELLSCDSESIRMRGIDYVVVDGSVKDYEEDVDCERWEVNESNSYFTVYSL